MLECTVCSRETSPVHKSFPFHGRHTSVLTYDINDSVGKIACWAVRFQQYDFKINYRKNKDHVVPEALSRAVLVFNIETENCSSTQNVDEWYQKMCTKVTEDLKQYLLSS